MYLLWELFSMPMQVSRIMEYYIFQSNWRKFLKAIFKKWDIFLGIYFSKNIVYYNSVKFSNVFHGLYKICQDETENEQNTIK